MSVRDRKFDIVKAAARLFRRRGYAATGINDILAAADAPKGSLYHYFPGGKVQIAVAAVEAEAERVAGRMEALIDEGVSAGDLVRRAGAYYAKWLEDSGHTQSCSVAGVLVGSDDDGGQLTAACHAAYARWRNLFAQAIVRDGASAASAEPLAVMALAVIQGGVLQARAECETAPLLAAVEEASAYLDQRIAEVS